MLCPYLFLRCTGAFVSGLYVPVLSVRLRYEPLRVCVRAWLCRRVREGVSARWVVHACVCNCPLRSFEIYMYILHLYFVAKFRRKQNSWTRVWSSLPSNWMAGTGKSQTLIVLAGNFAVIDCIRMQIITSIMQVSFFTLLTKLALRTPDEIL